MALDSFEKRHRGDLQGVSDSQDIDETEIPFSAFHSADIGPVNPDLICKLFLAESCLLP